MTYLKRAVVLVLLYLVTLTFSTPVDCHTHARTAVSVLSDPCADGLVCEENCNVFFPRCDVKTQFIIDDIQRDYPEVFNKVCSERYFQNGGFGDRMRNPLDRMMLSQAVESRPHLPRRDLTEYQSIQHCTGRKPSPNPSEYCLPMFLANFLRRLYIVQRLCQQNGIRNIHQLENEVIAAGHDFYRQFSQRFQVTLNHQDLQEFNNRIRSVAIQFAHLRIDGANDYCKCHHFGRFVGERSHEDRSFAHAFPHFQNRMRDACRNLCHGRTLSYESEYDEY